MREIKFRAWDIDGKQMIPWVEIKYDVTFEEVFDNEFLEVNQYTGLKDKNGVEIYEGDIIRYSLKTINGSIFTHICKVFKHESGTWRIEGHHEDNPSYKTKGTVYATHCICEVIGNIYENPELVK